MAGLDRRSLPKGAGAAAAATAVGSAPTGPAFSAPRAGEPPTVLEYGVAAGWGAAGWSGAVDPGDAVT